MRPKHVTKRAFVTKCRHCGAQVLYWECAICGAKVFFNYPSYGKAVKHVCNRYFIHNFNFKTNGLYGPQEEKFVDPLKSAVTESFKCPVCHKLFKASKDLDLHIKNMRKVDEAHLMIFEELNDLINFSLDDDIDTNQNSIENGAYHSRFSVENFKTDHFVRSQASFGRVVLKQKKKK